MHVGIMLWKTKRKVESYWKFFDLLPLVNLEKMRADYCKESGICDDCIGRICHVIDENGKLHCPILFADQTGLFDLEMVV